MKRHQLTRLPPYLILHTKRFTKNNFVEEKNPTIVNFPLRGVDMKDCAFSFFSPFPFPSSLPLPLLLPLPSLPFSYLSCTHQSDRSLLPSSLWLVPRADTAPSPNSPISTVYDLLVNIPFESSIASTTTKTGSATATNPSKKAKVDSDDLARWKVHLRAGGGGGEKEKWFSIEGQFPLSFIHSFIHSLSISVRGGVADTA
jgi:U4/U6.U5 tri-snRNP-associated protein 2